MSEPLKSQTELRHQTAWIFAAIILVGFALVWVFYCRTGVLESDLGGDPDEAAHAVTALMIRDYLVEGLGQSPMKFAREYYEHFPRVALGHYPPFYYLVAGVLLTLWDSITMLFVLQALLMALLAALTWLIGRRFLPSWLAVLAAAMGCALPVGLKLSQNIMSDVMLAILCLWAVLVWSDYLRAPTVKNALLWGCIAAAAILTKGSGMLLVAIPPLATVLAGKWTLIRTFSWWCAALPVILLAGPWMVYSTSISKEGMTELTPAQYVVEAVPFYLRATPFVFGWGITILAVVGSFIGLRKVLIKRAMNIEASALLALLCGTFSILVIVPVGLTTRYMLTLVPVIMLAAAFGIHVLTAYVHYRLRGAAALAIFMTAFTFVFNLPKKDVHGFSNALLEVISPVFAGSETNLLISSDPRGEGAVVASAAFNSSKRLPYHLRVYRASKELATSDWMGRDYKTAVDSPKSLLKLLDERHVTWVMIDLSVPDQHRKSHDRLLEESIRSSAGIWEKVHELQITRRVGQSGKMLIYKRLSSNH